MTYDFAYDFETLPTFGGVFDFRLCLRLSTLVPTFAENLELIRNPGRITGVGWGRGVGREGRRVGLRPR